MANKTSNNRFQKGIDTIQAQPNEQQIELQDTVSNENISNKTDANTSNKSILDNIRKEPRKKTGEIKTLYLSVDVAEALKEVSAEKGISESKIVNEVLRQILLP